MLPTRIRGRVLIIAGSDSGGGAGIQADIKSVSAMGAYAATAITAVTVQNTMGVTAIHDIPLDTIEAQIASVLDDLGTDAIKTGMLANASVARVVADALLQMAPATPWIVDPVMVAKGGASLLQNDALGTIRTQILPRAHLITPNLPEAEALTGLRVQTKSEMKIALKALQALGAKAVLLKGGHLPEDRIIDVYAGPEGTHEWQDQRIATRHTHGTGCSLASAIAAGVAQSMPMVEAIDRARRYVRIALETAPGFGQGHGPLNHLHTVRPLEE